MGYIPIGLQEQANTLILPILALCPGKQRFQCAGSGVDH